MLRQQLPPGMMPSEHDAFMPKAPILPKSDLPVPIEYALIAGKKISGQDPAYPPISRTDHQEGLVVLGAVINEQGQIEDLKVLEQPSEQLADSAVAAVRTWKYEPYVLNGSPVNVESTIDVAYNLAY